MLRRHEAEGHDLVVGDVAQRGEVARAVVVVLEEEDVVGVGALEDGLGDLVVAALAHPLPRVVAAAQVQTQARVDALHHRVEQLDALAQHPLRRDADRRVEVALGRVDEGRELGRVDLDVRAAHLGECERLGPHDGRGVPEGVERVVVDLGRDARLPEQRQHERARQRDLHRQLRAAAGVGVLLGRQRPARREALDDRGLHVRLLAVVVVPGDLRPLDGTDAVDRVRQRAHERQAAQLAVGHDLHPGALLQRDRLIDRAVLDPLELRPRDRPRGDLLACVEQLLRAQHAPHDLGPDDVRHAIRIVAVSPGSASAVATRRAAGPRADTLAPWRITPPCRSAATASCSRQRWR